MTQNTVVAFCVIAIISGFVASESRGANANDRALGSQQAVVKLYGAGGVRGLEGYQSGVCLDAEGAVLTMGGTVLDFGGATVVNAIGDRYEVRTVGVDHRTGLALLKPATPIEAPDWFALEPLPEPALAEAVWVHSNAFAIAKGDEAVTAQRARVAAIAPMPATGSTTAGGLSLGVPVAGARVLLLDAVTSNPGGAGGAVVDLQGRLRGLLGAEVRSSSTGAWLNYAIPTGEIVAALDRLNRGVATSDDGRAEVPMGNLRGMGIRLIPRVTGRTPAYVESVEPGSSGDQSGFRPDDLIVAIGGATVGDVDDTARKLATALAAGEATVSVTVIRDEQIVSLELTPE